MSGGLDKTQYILPLDQPVVSLEASTAFNGLTNKEQQYAYHLSQASWTGGLITLVQTSIESGPIFVLLHKLFSADNPKEFRAKAVSAGFADEDVTALLVYASGVFANAGNYKGFGDTKFIPGIEETKLGDLLKVSSVWDSIESLWEANKKAIYDLSPGHTCLGFPPHGCTTYLSKNCHEGDNERVQNWMKSIGLECYNTRCFKTENDGKTEYEIRLAGYVVGEEKREVINGYTYVLKRGDYTSLMKELAEHIKSAIPHSANTAQADMLQCYYKSFIEGSLQEHKNGSRFWIKDKGPAVETYIGFIETYRDPAGVRGEFEGFVSAVNREMSAKFTTLVDSAERLLPLLPWSSGFEKDKFLRPDFTSLDVITFAGSGIPAGINIPNYDEIRQSEGFKNVSLGNIISASYQLTTTPFLEQSDSDLLQKYRTMAFEVQVGLHELLGHGSGKLFQKDKQGCINYSENLLNPLTGEPIATFYEPGDSYDSKFGPLSSAYEECRAEAVGLYLSLEPSVLKIFGYSGDEAEDIIYVNWLSLVWAGLCALEMWDPNRGWLQAHSQARFGLMNVLIQAGVVSVKQNMEGNNLLIKMDRTAFKGAGRLAIGQFLLQLQVYKSTGDIENAKKLFAHFTNVGEPWKTWRAIVLANKRPRKMFAQPNLILNESLVEYKSYDSNPEGLIQSWVERFKEPKKYYDALMEIAKAEAPYFI